MDLNWIRIVTNVTGQVVKKELELWLDLEGAKNYWERVKEERGTLPVAISWWTWNGMENMVL